MLEKTQLRVSETEGSKMRLKVIQSLGNSAWGMECSIEIPNNLPNRLLAIGKGQFEVTTNEKGGLLLTLHN